jgi:hypothetical protein
MQEDHPSESGLAERLLEIRRDCAARIEEPYRSAEHGDLLYGADGLPSQSSTPAPINSP